MELYFKFFYVYEVRFYVVLQASASFLWPNVLTGTPLH